jgi:hypothetical protein
MNNLMEKEKKTIKNMKGQERKKLKRGIEESMRARKVASMINSIKQ